MLLVEKVEFEFSEWFFGWLDGLEGDSERFYISESVNESGGDE